MWQFELNFHSPLVEMIGIKRFKNLYIRVYVYKCKKAGLSQGETLVNLNSDLNAQGQGPVQLSKVKNVW